MANQSKHEIWTRPEDWVDINADVLYGHCIEYLKSKVLFKVLPEENLNIFISTVHERISYLNKIPVIASPETAEMLIMNAINISIAELRNTWHAEIDQMLPDIEREL